MELRPPWQMKSHILLPGRRVLTEAAVPLTDLIDTEYSEWYEGRILSYHTIESRPFISMSSYPN
jgi:hypothetical protein